MAQTAVEYLVNIVQSCIAPNYIPKEIIEVAKEMEKEQIIIARWIGDYSCDSIKAEQYYNETYNK